MTSATASSKKKKTLLMLVDKILVKPFEPSEKTEGGIVIPEVAKEKALSGVVVAVGPTVPTAKPGDVIYYTRYAGSDVRYDNEDFRVMTEAEALLVEREGK